MSVPPDVASSDVAVTASLGSELPVAADAATEAEVARRDRDRTARAGGFVSAAVGAASFAPVGAADGAGPVVGTATGAPLLAGVVTAEVATRRARVRRTGAAGSVARWSGSWPASFCSFDVFSFVTSCSRPAGRPHSPAVGRFGRPVRGTRCGTEVVGSSGWMGGRRQRLPVIVDCSSMTAAPGVPRTVSSGNVVGGRGRCGDPLCRRKYRTVTEL